jgi:charged multivesicular body protein 7
VIEEAVNKKELVPLQDFLDSKQSIYAKSWVPTPWQVVSWGLRQLGVLGKDGADDRLVTGTFVIMANVEAAAKAVVAQVSKTASNTSRIFSRDLFAEQVASTVGVDALSQRDLSVLLIHLARDHAALAYDARTGTIKFKAPSETISPTVQQEDITIASLRTLITSLEPQIQQLMKRVAELDTQAREMVAAKQHTSAKGALRQKKLADTKLQQRTATLAQLEDVYSKIEQAADQLEIVRVMEASGQALRSLNQKTGGVEKVQDIMEGLREEMMNADEIQQAINEVSASAIDEGEVDEELEALERVEREKAEKIEREERERKEALEAEETRNRLAELDEVEKKEVVAAAETQTTEEKSEEAKEGQTLPVRE